MHGRPGRTPAHPRLAGILIIVFGSAPPGERVLGLGSPSVGRPAPDDGIEPSGHTAFADRPQSEEQMPRRRHWFGLSDESLASPDVAVLGLPWVGAGNRRSGAALAPGRLRDLSTTSDPIGRRGQLVETLRLRDYGDVPAVDAGGQPLSWKEYSDRAAAKLDALPAGAFPLLLGGDNA